MLDLGVCEGGCEGSSFPPVSCSSPFAKLELVSRCMEVELQVEASSIRSWSGSRPGRSASSRSLHRQDF